MKRVMGSADSDEDARLKEFNGNPILVTRNEVSTVLNFDLTRKTAVSVGLKQIVSIAIDHISNHTLKDASKRLLLDLGDSKTAVLPGFLPLVIEMPLIIKCNNATKAEKLLSLGICNGTKCTLRKIFFHLEEPDFDHKTWDPLSPISTYVFDCLR